MLGKQNRGGPIRAGWVPIEDFRFILILVPGYQEFLFVVQSKIEGLIGLGGFGEVTPGARASRWRARPSGATVANRAAHVPVVMGVMVMAVQNIVVMMMMVIVIVVMDHCVAEVVG